jgi:hypothetical protein
MEGDMVRIDKETTEITVELDDLVQSIATLMDMREFFGKQEEMEGRDETCKALQTAIEVMTAFGCMHFEAELEDEE